MSIRTPLPLVLSPGVNEEEIWGALEPAAPEQEAAPPAPAPARVPQFPTVDEVKKKIRDLFFAIPAKRRPRLFFLDSVEEELGVEGASPEKRLFLMKLLRKLHQQQNLPNSGQNAKAILIDKLGKWSNGRES
jgi:hypothetical protein